MQMNNGACPYSKAIISLLENLKCLLSVIVNRVEEIRHFVASGQKLRALTFQIILPQDKNHLQ